MGRIRNQIIKRAGEKIVAQYYSKLENDFYHNKMVIKEVAEIQSKRLTNQVAGFATRLYGRVQKCNVKNIFIKKHEEERERKENLIPAISILDVDRIEVDEVTMKMLTDNGYESNFFVTSKNE